MKSAVAHMIINVTSPYIAMEMWNMLNAMFKFRAFKTISIYNTQVNSYEYYVRIDIAAYFIISQAATFVLLRHFPRDMTSNAFMNRCVNCACFVNVTTQQKVAICLILRTFITFFGAVEDIFA